MARTVVVVHDSSSANRNFLDGAPAGTLDAYIPPRTFDNDLWRHDGLAARQHTVRIVTRDDANPQSTGKRAMFEVGIVYRAR
jgi:hypothetical protein